jgi:hypothetical protein
MMDLDVEVCKICSSSVFPPRESFSTKYSAKIPVETSFPVCDFEKVLLEERPDFVLASAFAFNSLPFDVLPIPIVPVLPTYGFDGGLVYANRLQLKLKYPLIEGWRFDKKFVQGCA